MNHLGNKNLLLVRHLARTDYQIVYDSMKEFARIRSADTNDELWITEHDPVFTQGQSGKPEHVIAPGDIPVIQSNRGGQITYHGPGQIVAYLLFDISRMNLSVREILHILFKHKKMLLLTFLTVVIPAGIGGCSPDGKN
mgnify:CR=1 FL=1